MRPKEDQWQDVVARAYGLPLPISFTYQVTEDCTLACTYCYQNNKSPKRMSWDIAKRATDYILSDRSDYINTQKQGGLIVEFIGGEPLMEIELITEITEYLKKEMFQMGHPWYDFHRLSICSNGTEYFNPKVQEYLKRHLSSLSFSISIDGNKRLHDACRVFPDGGPSYDVAIAGVEHFTKVLKGRMGSKMTLAPENIAHTFEAVKSMVEYPYKIIYLNCVYEEGWDVSHARVFWEQLNKVTDYLANTGQMDDVYLSIFEEHIGRPKPSGDDQNWCGGTGKMLAVDPDGNFFPCLRYMKTSLAGNQEPICIGNVFDGIGKTARHCDHIDCLNRIDRRTQSTDECYNCPIADGCAWCSAYNYEVFGTPDKRAIYICPMHKARVLANVRFWNLYYQKYSPEKVFVNHCPKKWALEIISEEEWDALEELQKR